MTDERLFAATTEIVPFSRGQLMDTVFVARVVRLPAAPVFPRNRLVAPSRWVPGCGRSSPLSFSPFVISSDPSMTHHSKDNSTSSVVENDGQISTLSLAFSLSLVPSSSSAVIFVVEAVALFNEPTRDFFASFPVQKQCMSTPTGANRVLATSVAYVIAPAFVDVTRMRFDTSPLVCRQFESRRTATDCIFPNCAAFVTAWALAFVLVARMRWSFGAVLDFIAVRDGEVEERWFAESRGFLTEKRVSTPSAACEAFVPHPKLAEVADEPLVLVKSAVGFVLFLTQHPSRFARHLVLAT